MKLLKSNSLQAQWEIQIEMKAKIIFNLAERGEVLWRSGNVSEGDAES